MNTRFRRSQLVLGGAALAFNIVRAPARAAQFTYKLAHQQSVELPLHVRTVQMANAVKAETNGRLELQIFPNSVLGGQTSMLGQVRIGSIHFLILGDSNYTPVVPSFGVESLGYVFTTFNQPIAAYAGPLGNYIRAEFAAKGMYALDGCYGFGFRQLTSSTKPIRSVDDMQGFRLRVVPSPIIVDFFKTLGASPTAIDSTEMYTAMQTHIVDGQDGPIATIESFRLYEVQKYLCMTNHTWTGSTMVSNGDAWKALPPDIQDIVKRNYKKYTSLATKDLELTNAAIA